MTTGGFVALVNLRTQIQGLSSGIHRLLSSQGGASTQDSLFVALAVALIDLLELRGHFDGRVADYEQACDLGEILARANPGNGTALIARARTRATLHRFSEALSDLTIAASLGVSKSQITSERAGILRVLGRHEEANALLGSIGRKDDSASAAHLAIMHAERGQIGEADHFFENAWHSYRGVSPFPPARIKFQRGVMWHREGNLHMAASCYADALLLVPQYTPALGHLAEIEIHRGNVQSAAARLKPLTSSSDDPEYSALLATALAALNRHVEAQTWRERASIRYDELVMRHPEAYVHHAADFWLREGADPERARELALQDLQFRETPRARALYERALRECAKQFGHSGCATSAFASD